MERTLHFLSEYINNHEQNIGSNMDVKVHSGEVSDGSEGCVVGGRRKGWSLL